MQLVGLQIGSSDVLLSIYTYIYIIRQERN